MKIRQSAAGFLICLLAAHMAAQEANIPVKLSDCINAALEKNAAIKVGEARISAAEAKIGETHAALLPLLKFSGRAAQLSSVPVMSIALPLPGFQPIQLFPSIEQNYAARVTVQQPIFAGFRLQKNEEIAEHSYEAARNEYSRDQADLVLSVTVAYWTLYRSIEVERLVSQTVDQVIEHLKDVQNFAKQGLVTNVDVMKVQVQLSDVQVKQIEARSAIRLAAMSLNSLVGNPLETRVVPSEKPEIPADTSAGTPGASRSLQSLLEEAKSNRPELKTMQSRRDLSIAGVDLARGGWYPQIALAANYDYSRPNQRILPPKDQWDGTWDIGISLQWNIWDWNTTGYQTAQAEATLKQVDASASQLQDGIAVEVAQQYFKRAESKDKIAVAKRGVEQAVETQRITAEKFKRGVATNTELLDAEVASLQAELTFTQAIIDYNIVVARLKKAVGM
jgi:outer membrane protein